MKQLETLLSEMIAIKSVNPRLVAGEGGEGEIAAYIARWLDGQGLDVQIIHTAPERPNIVAVAHGSGGGKNLLLNGHIDTVGAGRMDDPFTPKMFDRRLYGRGAYDMKGGLAACMAAIAQARRLALRGDVILTAVVDEEFAGEGTMTVAERVHADGAIIAEPTEEELIIAHGGFAWIELETRGVAAHGSRPDLGVDAILEMGKALSGLDRLRITLGSHPPHPLVGAPSLHTSIIQGGSEPATYPDRCVLSIERRTIPGETAALVEAEIEKLIQEIRSNDPTFQAHFRTVMFRPPLETPADAEIVQAVKRAGEITLNKRMEDRGVRYWTDAATLWSAGVPSVLLGPRGGGAHADEEWVDLDSVAACADVFLNTAQVFCA